MIFSRLRRRTFLVASLGPAATALGQRRPKVADLKSIAIDTEKLPWEQILEESVHRTFSLKRLVRDSDTGMEISMVRYPAGFVLPLHTHPCAHGMYVLTGVLVTNEGRFAPGSFVWFPEGLRMEHGATAEQDVTVLFVTNKPFGIQYV
jgi:quercetin dioxygenase-like cupin family protein